MKRPAGLTCRPACPHIARASRPDGRSGSRRGGKSGLHGSTAPDNVRRGRPQGKCHRNQTASGPPAARVKRCGKSAPRVRQRKRQGKPHREQSRIGVARSLARDGFCFRSRLRTAARVDCSRRQATGVPEEWPSRGSDPALQNPAYRPAGTLLPSFPVPAQPHPEVPPQAASKDGHSCVAPRISILRGWLRSHLRMRVLRPVVPPANR